MTTAIAIVTISVAVVLLCSCRPEHLPIPVGAHPMIEAVVVALITVGIVIPILWAVSR